MPVWTGRAVVALAAVSVMLPLVPTDGGRDLVQTFVQLCCLVLAWHHVRRHRDVIRLGWGLLTLAVTVLGLSDTCEVLEVHIWHLRTSPQPSVIVALTGYVMLGLAMIQLDRNRSRGRRMPGRTEAAIFATGALVPLLVFLVIPIMQSSSMAAGARVVTVCYAVADLVVVTAIARLLLTDGSQSRTSAYLSAALLFLLAGDLWSWATTENGPVSEVPAVKVLWLGGFVLFTAAVAHPSMVTFTSGGGWSQDAPRKRQVWLMGVGQTMPPVTLFFACLSGSPSCLLLIAVGGLIVSLLASARMNSLLDRIGEQSSRLADLARSDELTGLHNRRSWNFELERACRAAEETGESLGVALLDLDHFKGYNDSYGHPAGDRLLAAAARSWSAALRPGEVLARYGGEEFAVLVPGATLEEAIERIDVLRTLTPGGQTLSAGVTIWSAGDDPEQSVADADTALYRAKRQGRDLVLPFEPVGPRAEPVVPFAIRTVVQPIVRVHDLAVIAYEALSRFDPATDVEAVFAEAHQEGYGALLEASAVLGALRLPGRPEGVEIFVNVSEQAMDSTYFWESVPTRLDGVVMELHEARSGLDDVTVSRMLDRLRGRGARICLDDLVATQADLDRIVSLRPDLVKVDRSLVAGCDTRPDLVAQIERILSFSQAYDVTVCAEGVETRAELLRLRSIGIGYVQGYLLGRPEPTWLEPLEPALRVGPLDGGTVSHPRAC